MTNERKAFWRGALFGWATLLALLTILRFINRWMLS